MSTAMAYSHYGLDLYTRGAGVAYMSNNKPLYKGQG